MVAPDVEKDGRDAVLGDQDLRQRFFQIRDMRVHAAPDAAGHRVVEDGVGREYLAVAIPIPVVDEQ